MRFTDRHQAGQLLAQKLLSLGHASPNALVLALPRGGLPVAHQVARALGAPLDVFIVRKLGFPGHEEFAVGAIASGGTTVLDEEMISSARIPRVTIDQIIDREKQELLRREQAYRPGRGAVIIKNRDVIIVDDGLATGSTMKAAVRALRTQGPRSLTVAVPVGAAETCRMLAHEADHVVCLATPDPFHAVGMWYDDFNQTTDDEVKDILRQSQPRAGAQP